MKKTLLTLFIILLISPSAYALWGFNPYTGKLDKAGVDVMDTDCSTYTAEGQICWDTDSDTYWVGNGSTATQIGAGGSVSDAVYDATWNGDTTNAASKNAIYDKIETLGGGHDPVSLDVNADTLLALSTQALGLDTQTANYVFAGAVSGAAAVPTFRALVDNDVPDTITVNLSATASALAADPSDCAANQFANAIAANGNLTCGAIGDADVPNDITITLAATATALAANGANCGAGNSPLGVDASGAVESCFDVWTEAENTAASYISGSSPSITTPTLTLQDGNGAAPTTDGQIKYDRTTEILQVGDGAATKSFYPTGTMTDTKYCIYTAGTGFVCNSTPAGTGDVESVGNCTGGACLDGTSDGGTNIALYDGDSNKTTVQASNTAGDVVVTLPATTGTLIHTESDPNALLTAGTDNVKDTHIDWGTGANQVNPADFANQDIGDITITGGDWAVENASHTHTASNISDLSGSTDITADLEEEAHCSEHDGRSTTCSSEVLNADAELYTDSFCATIETPTDADDFLLFRNDKAITVTSIDCIVEAATSAVVVINECDSAGDNCGSANSRVEESLTCDVDGATDDGTIGNSGVAVGAWVRGQVGTVTGTVGHVSICTTYTFDD